MPMYDYVCPDCDEHYEAMNSIANRETSECPNCHSTGKRIPSATRCKLDGTSGDFPGEHMRWERVRKQKMAQERKQGNHE